MRSENTHPVAHPFRGEAFPLLASSVFLSPRWRLTVTGEYSTGKNKIPLQHNEHPPWSRFSRFGRDRQKLSSLGRPSAA